VGLERGQRLLLYDERAMVSVIVFGVLVLCFERLRLDAFAMIRQWATTYMGDWVSSTTFLFSIVPGLA